MGQVWLVYYYLQIARLFSRGRLMNIKKFKFDHTLLFVNILVILL